jgi:hypothetical protein
MPRHPLPCTALAAALAAAAALIPAAAAPAQSAPVKGLTLSAKPDPAVPQDRTPKILFSLLNTVKHRAYNVEIKQTSGENPLNEQGFPVVCQSTVSRFSDTVSTGSKLTFLALPLGGYVMGASSPCVGHYDGKVTTPRRGAPDRVLQTFRFRVPEMTISKVSIRATR